MRQLREADGERRLYSPQRAFADVIKDEPGDTEEVKTFRAEVREQFADLGLSNVDARQVTAVFEEALKGGEMPGAEQRAQWQREALDAVVRQYGEKEAAVRLREARALIARDPRVQRILDATGLGSHPRLVLLAIEQARSARMKGKLKL